MSEPSHRPTADVAFGRAYRLLLDGAREHFLMCDGDGQTVAVLRRKREGDAWTQRGRWALRNERRGIGWAVIARTVPGGVESGGIREGLIPSTFKLWVGTRALHAIRNPLTGDWTISDGLTRLFHVGDVRGYVRTGLQQPTKTAGTVTTFDPPSHDVPLGLAIALTLEMIKADAAIPNPIMTNVNSGAITS